MNELERALNERGYPAQTFLDSIFDNLGLTGYCTVGFQDKDQEVLTRSRWLNQEVASRRHLLVGQKHQLTGQTHRYLALQRVIAALSKSVPHSGDTIITVATPQDMPGVSGHGSEGGVGLSRRNEVVAFGVSGVADEHAAACSALGNLKAHFPAAIRLSGFGKIYVDEDEFAQANKKEMYAAGPFQYYGPTNQGWSSLLHITDDSSEHWYPGAFCAVTLPAGLIPGALSHLNAAGTGMSVRSIVLKGRNFKSVVATTSVIPSRRGEETPITQFVVVLISNEERFNPLL